MGSPQDTVHQYRIEAIQKQQADSLAALADVVKQQSIDAEASRRSAWWFSMASSVIAGMSLVVAILALTLR